MSKTKIEWTEYSWNPMRGCSPGQIGEKGPEWTGKVALIEGELERPFGWKKPRRVAVGLMGDWMRLSEKDRDKILAVEALCPQHQFLHLTKLAGEMRGYFAAPAYRQEVIGIIAQCLSGLDRHFDGPGTTPGYGVTWRLPFSNVWPGVSLLDPWRLPFSNVWPGVSLLDQADAAAAREPMRELAAAGWNTWVSHEPAWGGIDWTGWEFLRYMVSGGQTGPGARPSHPDWFRADRDFCARAGIPWMFKAWGAFRPHPSPVDYPYDKDYDRLHWWDQRDCVRPVEDGWSDRYRAGAGAFPPPPFNVFEMPEYRDQVARCSQDECRAAGKCCGNKGKSASIRVGKKRAGRLLDGREHLEMPEVGRG